MTQEMSQTMSQAAVTHRPSRTAEPDMFAQDAAPPAESSSRLGLLGLLADVISGGKLSELQERLDRSLKNETRLFADLHQETLNTDHAMQALRSLQEELASCRARNQELARIAQLAVQAPQHPCSQRHAAP